MRPSRQHRTSWAAVAALLAVGVGVVVFVVVVGNGRGHAPHLISIGPDRLRVQVPSPDPWAAYLAPDRVCPGRDSVTTDPRVQQQTAICLLDYAREHEGLGALPESRLLSATSSQKAQAIVSCDDFSHTPCGRAGDSYARAAGIQTAFGENIYAGIPTLNSPLAAVDAWLNSPEHRANLFRPGWQSQGIALYYAHRLLGNTGVAVWVSEFAA